jgi:hypothetical protein
MALDVAVDQKLLPLNTSSEVIRIGAFVDEKPIFSSLPAPGTLNICIHGAVKDDRVCGRANFEES